MLHRTNNSLGKILPYLFCGLTGFGAGLLNGLLGAAGGILLVVALPHLTPPVFLYPPDCPLSRYHERRDILASAMTVMLPISVVSGAFYWLGGIRPSPTLLLALILPAAAGGWIGAKLLTVIPNHLLKKFFAAVVVIAGIRMLFG